MCGDPCRLRIAQLTEPARIVVDGRDRMLRLREPELEVRELTGDLVNARGRESLQLTKLGGQPITATFKLVLALDSTGRSQKEIAAALEADGVASLTDVGDVDVDTLLSGARTSSSKDDRPFTPELVLARLCAVDPNGATRDIRVRGAYRRLRSCMKSQVATWSFPTPPDAPAHFEVPFTM